MESFKDRLKELRETEGISMMQLANALGVSNAAICKWENGVAEPKVSYLIKISDFFDCTVDYLVGKTNDYTSGDITKVVAPQKLSLKEKQLIDSFRELSPKMKTLIQETIKAWKNMNDTNE